MATDGTSSSAWGSTQTGEALAPRMKNRCTGRMENKASAIEGVTRVTEYGVGEWNRSEEGKEW